MKILSIVICILSLYAYFLTKEVIERGKNIDTLEREKKELINDRERLVKNEVAVRKQNALLEEEIKKDKSGFDWHYNLTDNPVRLWVSEECLSCNKSRAN